MKGGLARRASLSLMRPPPRAADVSAMPRAADASPVQRAADVSPATIACHESNVNAIASKGGLLEALVALTREGTPSGQQRAAATLAVLACSPHDDTNREAIVERAGLEALTSLVRDGTAAAKDEATRALRHVGHNRPDIQQRISELEWRRQGVGEGVGSGSFNF